MDCPQHTMQQGFAWLFTCPASEHQPSRLEIQENPTLPRAPLTLSPCYSYNKLNKNRLGKQMTILEPSMIDFSLLLGILHLWSCRDFSYCGNPSSQLDDAFFHTKSHQHPHEMILCQMS